MRSLVGKMTEQKGTRGRQIPARPIVGSVVALVMLVQSLATIMLTQAHFGRGDIGHGLIALSFEANCSAGPIGDGGAPKQERHDCAKCGILCSARDCDTPFHFATPTAGAQFRSQSRRVDDSTHRRRWPACGLGELLVVARAACVRVS